MLVAPVLALRALAKTTVRELSSESANYATVALIERGWTTNFGS